MSPPEVAVLVSTYQRPRHLERVLLSLRLQQAVPHMEVVVTDDGSQDETLELIQQFAREAPFPVRLTTHPHKTLQVARCRNEGVAASSAPYLIFLDGDCLVPPDYVHQHLKRRRPNTVMAGACCQLDQVTTQRISTEAIAGGRFLQWIDPKHSRHLSALHWKSWFFSRIHHPLRPRLYGGNLGIWRQDYQRVNGYDERLEDAGVADHDLRIRLHQAGVRVQSIVRWTRTYHLWHPLDTTARAGWLARAKMEELASRGRLTRCLMGLSQRTLNDLRVRALGQPVTSEFLRRVLERVWPDLTAGQAGPAQHGELEFGSEVEILVAPGHGWFSRRAQVKILVLLEDVPAARKLMAAADIIVANFHPAAVASSRLILLDEDLQARRAA